LFFFFSIIDIYFFISTVQKTRDSPKHASFILCTDSFTCSCWSNFFNFSRGLGMLRKGNTVFTGSSMGQYRE